MQENFSDLVLSEEHYLHCNSDEIRQFIQEVGRGTATIEDFFSNVFQWFDSNIEYSRLNSPFVPLQRSDLSLLKMKSGTCGDYSNLIVSVLLTLGIPAKYAYLKRDCYGDEQDHICAAAFLEKRWILIDATLPYRKWYGFDCPHQEFELLDPDEFERRMKCVESKCIAKATKWGVPQYSGILYAPWVYDEIVINTEKQIDSVFYLFILNTRKDWTLYINYLTYTRLRGYSPFMVTLTPQKTIFRVSVNQAISIWDETQWSNDLTFDEIPEEYRTVELHKLCENMKNNVPRILSALGFSNMS